MAVVACVAWKGQQHEGLSERVRRHWQWMGAGRGSVAWENGRGCSWLPSEMVKVGEGGSKRVRSGELGKLKDHGSFGEESDLLLI